MTKKALLLLLTLLTTSAMWAQSVPPMGTKCITLEVQPGKTFQFGLIARSDARQAWIELQEGEFTPLSIGDNSNVPTAFKYTSTSGRVKIYGAFHIFGCPANGAVITGVDATNFTPLEQLYCDNNALTALSVKGCSKLRLLSCATNALTSLDLSGCATLEELSCFNNQLTSLALTSAVKLQKINCAQNALTTLDLSACPKLQAVYAGENQIASIALPATNEISVLSAYQNKIQSLDLSRLPLLEDLDIYDNQLTALDLHLSPKLTRVDCSENKLTQLDLTASRATLTTLSCSDNQITQLQITGCTLLSSLNASNNQLSSITLTGFAALERLSIYANQLTALDVTDCTALVHLSADENNMDACSLNDLFRSLPTPQSQGYLSIVGNPGATTSTTTLAQQRNWQVDVQGDNTGCPSGDVEAPPAGTPVITLTTKPGSTITVTMRVYEPNSYVWIEATPGTFQKMLISSDYDNPSEFHIACPGSTVRLHSNVADFSCSKNGEAITAIDASHNPELGTLYCHENAITSIKVTGCPYLADLSCGKNQIKELDLTGLNYLQYLYCYENQIDRLDIAHCKLLQELECSANNIEQLDLSNLSKATLIMCHTNRIQELDLSNCKKLEEFSCANNQIRELRLDACESLKGFACGSNLLTQLDLSKCTKLNRLFCSVNPHLTQITLAPHSVLQQFSAMECGLTRLEIPESPSLTKVQLTKNPLQSLTLGNCNKLNYLSVDQCAIAPCDMNQLFEALPEVTTGEIRIAGNPEVATAKTDIATQKGWQVDVTGDGSGCPNSIESIDETTYRITTAPHTIEVTTPQQAQVIIYDTTGHQVSSCVTEPHRATTIRHLVDATYIVSIDGKAYKVLVR